MRIVTILKNTVTALCVLAMCVVGLALLESWAGVDSDASVPTRVTCGDEWQHAKSSEAKTCRERGWYVTSKYVLTPGRVPVYINLPSCEYEDGSSAYGVGAACSWNVNSGDGNGVGLRYLVTNVRSVHGVAGKRYIYLRECYGKRCRAAVSSAPFIRGDSWDGDDSIHS